MRLLDDSLIEAVEIIGAIARCMSEKRERSRLLVVDDVTQRPLATLPETGKVPRLLCSMIVDARTQSLKRTSIGVARRALAASERIRVRHDSGRRPAPASRRRRRR